MGNLLEKLNHPLTFAITMTLVVFAVRDLAIMGAKRMNWNGVVSFFK